MLTQLNSIPYRAALRVGLSFHLKVRLELSKGLLSKSNNLQGEGELHFYP